MKASGMCIAYSEEPSIVKSPSSSWWSDSWFKKGSKKGDLHNSGLRGLEPQKPRRPMTSFSVRRLQEQVGCRMCEFGDHVIHKS